MHLPHLWPFFFSFFFLFSFIFLPTVASINFRTTQSQFYKSHNNHKISFNKNQKFITRIPRVHNNHKISFHKTTKKITRSEFTIITRVYWPNFLDTPPMEDGAPLASGLLHPCSPARVAQRRQAAPHCTLLLGWPSPPLRRYGDPTPARSTTRKAQPRFTVGSQPHTR